MSCLTQIARRKYPGVFKQRHAFYDAFLSSVKAHGRVNEVEFMSLYFWQMKNPVLPLKYAILGMKLVSRGKISMPFSAKERKMDKLTYLFDRAQEME